MKPFVPQRVTLAALDWEPLVPQIGRANRALAYYDGVLYGLANPGVMLAPLTTQEAVLSAKIEGTQATLGEVFKFEAGEAPKEESRRLDIQEIINYRRAMRLAEEELKTRPFSLNLLKSLHAALLEDVRGRDKERGRFRTVQNWIGTPGSPIESAQFVPPEPLSLMGHLDHWEKFYHQDSPDALVQLAIVHAQFEVIHPFLDGNGRLGRMIIPLFLCEKQLLSRPTFYISAYLEDHRAEYVAKLRALADEPPAWNDWIVFFLTAVYEQAVANATKAREIIDLYDRLKIRVIELTHSRFAVPLLDHLFEQPVFLSSSLDAKPDMPTKPAILTLLGKLKGAGVLKVVRKGSGRRPQVLALAELINLCEGKEVI
jgi:Fic family protein